MFRNKILIGVGVILLIATFFFSWQEHSSYHKVVRLEYFAKIVLYSAVNHLAAVTSSWGKVSFSLPASYFLQENALTCEVAALRTALNYQGTYVSEAELLEKLAFDTRKPMATDGTWGDPENGFIGDVNGSIFRRTGFGVYDKPILDLALKYNDAAIIEDADLAKVIAEVLSDNPVIVWGLLSRRAPVSWFTKEGKFVEVRPGEHARVVIGFTGHSQNPREIILLDPIYGKIRMSKNRFVSDWEIMDNRAVVIYKSHTTNSSVVSN